MIWKNVNLQLQKGSIFLLYGDSAPIFEKVCRKTDCRKLHFDLTVNS